MKIMKISRKLLMIILGSLGGVMIIYALLKQFAGLDFGEGFEKFLYDVVLFGALGIFMYNRKLASDEKKALAAKQKEEEAAAAAAAAQLAETVDDADYTDIITGSNANDAGDTGISIDSKANDADDTGISTGSKANDAGAD
jgi:hypothetical protein